MSYQFSSVFDDEITRTDRFLRKHSPAFYRTLAESKMSLSVSTPDITPATGSAGPNTIVLPGYSNQTYTAGGVGTGMSFNITPAGEIQPPANINAGSSFTTRRASTLSVF